MSDPQFLLWFSLGLLLFDMLLLTQIFRVARRIAKIEIKRHKGMTAYFQQKATTFHKELQKLKAFNDFLQGPHD